MKRIFTFLLTVCLILTSFSNVTYANTIEEQSVVQPETLTTDVSASIGSSFTVRIPKSITVDAETKSSAYTVEVNGDVANTERVVVTPDLSFTLTQEGKEDVTATVTQSKTAWKSSEFGTVGNGLVDVPDLSAGHWSGFFNFNIELKSVAVTVISATDSAGNDLNASATSIVGEEKAQLLDSLALSGLVNSTEDVDAIIDVQADAFDSIADTVFDVSNIAQTGDSVVILHFDETKQEWEYIGTEVVDENGLIAGNFTSYSPVVFVKVENSSGGHIHYYVNGVCYCGMKEGYEPGLYDADGVMLCTWEESGIDISKDYYYNSSSPSNYYQSCVTSGYYVLKNVYPTARRIVIPENITKIGMYAFYNCDYKAVLEEVVIPASVKTISDYAFNGCTKMKNVYLMHEETPTIGGSSFYWETGEVTTFHFKNSIVKDNFKGYCRSKATLSTDYNW